MLKSIQEIIDYNIMFLQNQKDTGFGHYGPVCEETALIQDFLIQMNQKGLITSCSQPGIISQDYKQRSFVEFLCPKELVERFRYLNNISLGWVTTTEMFCQGFISEPITYVNNEPTTFNPLGALLELNCTLEDTTLELFESRVEPELIKFLNENYAHVIMYDTIWGRKNYLFNCILTTDLEIKKGAVIQV